MFKYFIYLYSKNKLNWLNENLKSVLYKKRQKAKSLWRLIHI